MRPKTRTEREVFKLSQSLSGISAHQKSWMLKQSTYANTHRFRGKRVDISHFIVATTKGRWQVLRHYYMYASYRYKKLHHVEYAEVMQQWFSDGEYVFLSRPRMPGYTSDAWCIGLPMEIRRRTLGGYVQCDPRDICYTAVYYAKLQKRFSYIPRDSQCDTSIVVMYRALNTHSFNETLFNINRAAFSWAHKNGFVFDKKKTTAIKIAVRHGYDFMNQLWRDLIEMLIYLGKDVHNPSLVCPANLEEAHDKWSILATNKRKKQMAGIERMRQIAAEKAELLRLENEAKREQERMTAITEYPKMRKPFFGFIIAEGNIEIKVLQSVAEFMEEGKEMSHCVFANEYYNVIKKPYCLILSAKVDGKRTETIEVDLRDYRVVQCRGKYNQSTPWHDKILELMNRNMPQLRQIRIQK